MKGKENLNKTSCKGKEFNTKEDLNILQVGDIKAELIYSKNGKKFYECMANVLKNKSKAN